MIYQVLKKGNTRFLNTTTHQFEDELEYAYYSFEEDSITEYSPDDIIEKDGELLSISGEGQDIRFFCQRNNLILNPNYSRISGIAYENGYVRENSSKTDTLQSFPPKKGALLPWGSDNF